MKKLLCLLFCAVLLCGAVGCGLVLPVPETQAPTETAEPTQWVLEDTIEAKKYEGVELVFLSCWAEDAAQAAVLTQAAEVFEMTTGAAVQILWSQDFENLIQTGDIYQLPGGMLQEYVDRVLDLTEPAQNAGYGQKSFSALTDQVISRCGKLAAIPQVPYLSGFYYNREAFESCAVAQPPQTWEQFAAVCAALDAGGWVPLTMNSESADDVLMLHLAQYLGAEAALSVARSGGWQDQAGSAVSDLIDLAAAGYLVRGVPADYPGGQNRIGLSNAVMIWGTNELCAQTSEAALAELDWGVFPYPGVAGAEPVISVESDVLAVAAECAQSQAAFEFILLLTTGEFDQLRADLTCGIPADPNNISPIRGAVEALQIAQIVENVPVEFTQSQLDTILKLWKGAYQQAEAFTEAMDALYSQS